MVRQPPSPARPERRWAWAGSLLVAAVAMGVAAAVLRARLAAPEELWRDPYHDRNTHLARGLNLALDLAGGAVHGFWLDAVAILSWPPLHPMLSAPVLWLGGYQPGLAVLPGLAGWVATVVFAWAIAWRLGGGAEAGVGVGAPSGASVAAGFVLASPALRLLAGDVMLEGLGSGLVAASLFCWVRAWERGWAAGPARDFALVLGALFFTKFNYWLVTAAALGLTAMGTAGWGRVLRAVVGSAAARDLVRQPLVLGGAALVAAGLLLVPWGLVPVTVLGRGLTLDAGSLLALPYGVLLLGGALVWRRHRMALRTEMPAPLWVLAGWHGLPVLLWFLVPGALASFLWVVGPTHQGGSLGYDPWAALAFHWAGFAGGFHVAPWSAVLALELALAGGVRLARGPAGGRGVAVLAGLAALVVVLHPQQQWRFQATFLVAVWICAGVGAAALLGRFRWPVGVAAVAGLAAAHLLQPPDRATAEAVALRRPAAASDVALAAAYLPLLGQAGAVGFGTTFGVSDLFGWTVQAACGCRRPVIAYPVQPAESRAAVARSAAAWIAATPAERFVFIDAPAPYALPGLTLPREALRGIGDALAASPALEPVTAEPVRVGEAAILVWRRHGPAPAVPRRFYPLGWATGLCGLGVLALAFWPRPAGPGGAARRLSAPP